MSIWRRALVEGALLASRGMGLVQRAVAEVPIMLQDPALGQATADRFYCAEHSYRERERQSAGLFPFEERALAGFFPPPPARIFVPAAGAGRELFALHARGYCVTGLEPNAAMIAGARAEISRRGLDIAIRQATLQQWVRTPDGQFDAIFTGWGLWVHMLHHADRIAVLQAFRRVCPIGPLLLSFWRGQRTHDHLEQPETLSPLHPRPLGRLNRVTRYWLRQRLLGRPPVERGTVYRRFLAHLSTEPELREEAALAGYEVAFYERDLSRYGNAVLRPIG